MALPVSVNTTCDIYRFGTAPPAAPAVAAVPCFLQSDWRGGQEAGDRGGACMFTHVMLLDAAVDIRDGYTGLNNQTQQDVVYIPNQNGTRFVVIFIERVQRGTPHEHKRVFLDRLTPTWPTNNL